MQPTRLARHCAILVTLLGFVGLAAAAPAPRVDMPLPLRFMRGAPQGISGRLPYAPLEYGR
ncbi:hypothetical protein C8Q79DRAFT_989576 [Trametes meyenii]|nr:hypothetical protein C8Q79DRAFT_989576 [Trametes meyenii]